MAKPAARQDDQHQCPKSGHANGAIQSGSANVMLGGKPAARVGDKIICEDGSQNSISDNKSCVLINGKAAARVGDNSEHDGQITSGANSILIADGPAIIRIGNKGCIAFGKNVRFYSVKNKA